MQFGELHTLSGLRNRIRCRKTLTVAVQFTCPALSVEQQVTAYNGRQSSHQSTSEISLPLSIDVTNI
jgi:hypothetical protein